MHKFSFVNRDPDEIKGIYIQNARQSSVSTFKKEVDEYCRHLWQREIKQRLMYSNYSGRKVRNSIMKMLAAYPRKVSVKTLRVLMNDVEVREVLFRSKKSKTNMCPYCRVVDGTAHFSFSCVSYQEWVRDISSPAIWATIWRRSHGIQKCRPNGLIKLINYLIYLKRLAYLLYGSVASLPSPSSNIEARPYGSVASLSLPSSNIEARPYA